MKVSLYFAKGFVGGLLVLAAAGCDSSTVRATGRVTIAGESAPGDKMLVSFYPVVTEKGKSDGFTALTRPDGTFEVLGRKGKGIPRGKYKIVVEFKSAVKSKTPLPKKTQVEEEVIGQDILIELAKPPGS